MLRFVLTFYASDLGCADAVLNVAKEPQAGGLIETQELKGYLLPALEVQSLPAYLQSHVHDLFLHQQD